MGCGGHGVQRLLMSNHLKAPTPELLSVQGLRSLRPAPVHLLSPSFPHVSILDWQSVAIRFEVTMMTQPHLIVSPTLPGCQSFPPVLGSLVRPRPTLAGNDPSATSGPWRPRRPASHCRPGRKNGDRGYNECRVVNAAGSGIQPWK